ncbi:hypothetical protein [Pseudomonas farris]|jgi:hypothetical protein
MTSFIRRQELKQRQDIEDARKKKQEVAAQLLAKKPNPIKIETLGGISKLSEASESAPPPSIVAKFGQANISLYRDDEVVSSTPAKALQTLTNLYLHAAKHRTRHIAMLWPACPKSLSLVHALATLEHWAEGNKHGIRGVIYPVKTNIFQPLNHIHLDREAVLRHAIKLAELQREKNSFVTQSFSDKDAYLFSLASLQPEQQDQFNPTISELLPHFLASDGFKSWQPCTSHLLSHIRARLVRRKHANALLLNNCSKIGDPKYAPDAIFALDGRLKKDVLKRALVELRVGKPPEVVLVVATRSVRLSSRKWKDELAHFCLLVEDVFPQSPPGVIVVTDEPHAAFALKNELWERNAEREKERRWRTPYEFSISGMPCTTRQEGLLPAGAIELTVPSPREFDVMVVDAEAAKVVNKLQRIVHQAPGGREAAKPIADAAWYLMRLATLPCGVRHLTEWLSSVEVDHRTRVAFDWLSYVGAVHQFDRSGGVPNDRQLLLECLAKGSELFERYQAATPFALRLAEVVSLVAASKKKRVAIVFTSALYRRLAERFLSEYDDYPDGRRFKDFSDRVHFVGTSQLEDDFDSLSNSVLVFAGLDEQGLRIVLSDDRIPPHSVLLLTQRGGQYLRASLSPIAERFVEFKAFKPRIESILRQLKDLPDNASVLSTSDFVLPTFRVELSSDISREGDEHDESSWRIVLESGQIIYRKDTHKVYVYDPASATATVPGFYSCEVRSLQTGDKLFVMSAELREMVEQVLRDAGIPIQHDKTFEGALRSYHEQVRKKFSERFPAGSLSDKVRMLRKAILVDYPKLEAELPTDQAMRQWVGLDESANTPFEQLRPQAPLKEANFKAFASALGMAPLEAAYQWQRVILAIRNSRRLDGRHVSDIYAYMLLQPESAMVHSNIRRHTLKMLFEKARDNVETIEAVVPNQGG